MCVLAHQGAVRAPLPRREASWRHRSLCGVKVPAKLLNGKIAHIQPSALMIDIEGREFERFLDIDLKTVRKIVVPTSEKRKPTRKMRVRKWIAPPLTRRSASHLLQGRGCFFTLITFCLLATRLPNASLPSLPDEHKKRLDVANPCRAI